MNHNHSHGDRILSPAIERRRLAALPTVYAHGERSQKEQHALATFKLALHVADTHLTPAEAKTPRHDLPFRRTLHLAGCDKCARANKAKGGPWRYDPAAKY